MAQGYKHDTMTLPELCSHIYSAFGEWAVINFIRDRQDVGYLKDVTWKNCDPCGEWCPIYEGSCLVCGILV